MLGSNAAMPQAVVDKLKHNYVRFAALQSQLLAEAQSTQPQAHPPAQSALKHFIGCTDQGKQYLDRITQQRAFSNGKYKNGVHTAPQPPSSAFIRQLQQEVERLRRFVHSFAEDLWMRLLATADGLCMARKAAAAAQSSAEQQNLTLQQRELAERCDRVGMALYSNAQQLLQQL